MDFSVLLYSGERICLHGVKTVEYAYINVGVILLELPDEFLDLFSFAD